MPRVKKYESRNCLTCNKSFQTCISNERGRKRKTCGERSCQDKLRLQTIYTKECTICKDIYNTPRLNSLYCGTKCRRKRHESVCEICSKKFRKDRPEIKYCSKDCVKLAHKKNIVKTKCDYCDEIIERQSNFIAKNKNKFCNSTCSNNYWGYKLFSGKSKYGGEWGTIRKKTLKYYNKKCQRCDCSITLKNCNIHHIVPIKYFGVENLNIANSIENLIPLCLNCHKKTHAENNKWYEENFGYGDFLKI